MCHEMCPDLSFRWHKGQHILIHLMITLTQQTVHLETPKALKDLFDVVLTKLLFIPM